MSLSDNEQDEKQNFVFKKFLTKKLENLSFEHGLLNMLIEKDKALEPLDFIDNLNEQIYLNTYEIDSVFNSSSSEYASSSELQNYNYNIYKNIYIKDNYNFFENC